MLCDDSRYESHDRFGQKVAQLLETQKVLGSRYAYSIDDDDGRGQMRGKLAEVVVSILFVSLRRDLRRL